MDLKAAFPHRDHVPTESFDGTLRKLRAGVAVLIYWKARYSRSRGLRKTPGDGRWPEGLASQIAGKGDITGIEDGQSDFGLGLLRRVCSSRAPGNDIGQCSFALRIYLMELEPEMHVRTDKLLTKQ